MEGREKNGIKCTNDDKLCCATKFDKAKRCTLKFATNCNNGAATSEVAAPIALSERNNKKHYDRKKKQKMKRKTSDSPQIKLETLTI